MVAQQEETIEFVWHQSTLDSGGQITGLLQHPQNPDVLYARCGVAGVFKSIDRGRSWQAFNSGMRFSYEHSVRSFAVDPQNPDVMFRCSGEARDQKRFGTIHKSSDGGKNWRTVCDEVDYYGNGPTRMYGEVIAIDPNDSAYVVTGGYSNGFWVSRDAGETWSCTGLEGERITGVYFHPLVEDKIYVGTASARAVLDMRKDLSSDELAAELKRLHDFERGTAHLFVSTNRGESWKKLCEGYDLAELVFDTEDPDTLYMATHQHGILRSTDGGASWEEKTEGLPAGVSYCTLSVAPAAPTVLYTAPDVRGYHIGVAPVPVYCSKDQGESWRLIKKHTEKDLKKYPYYMTLRQAGWAISKLLVDHDDFNRIYLSNLYGVAVSPDRGRTWNAHHYTGIEAACVEDICCDPSIHDRVYFAPVGHRPSLSRDGGRTYRTINLIEGLPFRSSTALVASEHRSDLLIYGMTNSERRQARRAAILRSEDGGRTSDLVFTSNPSLFVQALVEDPHISGTFYAYLDGDVLQGAGLYRSEDWGKIWRNLCVPLPDHIQTLPHQREWVEDELLSVTVSRVKRVCGTNQLLCVDPHREDTLYLGEWTEGIFRVTDEGRTVSRVDDGLPFGRHKVSTLVALEVDEARPGVLYAGFIREGLWRSEDYGETWAKLYPADDTPFNASSMAVGGPSKEEIVVACEPLYWSPVESAVYYSADNGETWVNIYDKAMGALRWKGMALDPRSGVIHGCTCGNGCFYAEPKPGED